MIKKINDIYTFLKLIQVIKKKIKKHNVSESIVSRQEIIWRHCLFEAKNVPRYSPNQILIFQVTSLDLYILCLFWSWILVHTDSKYWNILIKCIIFLLKICIGLNYQKTLGTPGKSIKELRLQLILFSLKVIFKCNNSLCNRKTNMSCVLETSEF